MSEPVSRDRPSIPEGYGLPETDEGLLDWTTIETLLVESLHYWMATTRPDGRPHVVPRWGVWLDGCLFYDGSPDTIHARNLSGNQACALHIGDGREAIMVEGKARPSKPVSGELGERIAAEISRKYGESGYRPEPDAWSGDDAGGLVVFSPDKAMAWFEFPTDLTRFTFGAPPNDMRG